VFLANLKIEFVKSSNYVCQKSWNNAIVFLR